jgi:hypothetical protein
MSTFINDIAAKAFGVEGFFRNPTLTQEGYRKVPWKTEFASIEKEGWGNSLIDSLKSVVGLENFTGIDRLDREFSAIEPHCTIFIKKKMFESVRDAWLLQHDEARLEFFIVKALILRKIEKLAAYEEISKFKTFQSFSSALGSKWRGAAEFTEDLFYENAVPEIAGLIKALRSKVKHKTRALFYPEYTEEENFLRKIWGFSGVIELGNFVNVTTTISIKEGGSCTVTLENPYHWMFITREEIIEAIDYVFGKKDKILKVIGGSVGKDFGISAPISDDEQARQNIMRRMFKYFAGHTIIQPIDTISVFMGRVGDPGDIELARDQIFELRKKVLDAAAAGDIKKVTKLQQRISNIEESVEKTREKQAQLAKKADEKQAQLEKPVFTGVVRRVEDTSSEGFYQVNIQAEDVKYWLSAARINAKPSLDQPKGALEYPLETYIVDKGKEILLQDADADAIEAAITAPPDKNLIKSKWKEGVRVAHSKLLHGSTKTPETPGNDPAADVSTVEDAQFNYGLNLYSEPLAGADIADSISLLITGLPYRKQTFAKAIKEIGRGTIIVGKNPEQSQEPAAPKLGYFAALQLAIRAQSNKFGGFIPFDFRDYDEEKLETYIENAEANTEFFKEEIAGIDEEIEKLEVQKSRTSTARLIANIDQKIEILRSQKRKLQKLSKRKTDKKEAIPDITKPLTKDSKADRRSQIIDSTGMPEINRGLMTVHQNEKYFVVSQEYRDLRYLQAFVRRIAGINSDIWNSEYSDVRTICEEIANIIDFEFFADASGNLIFRPPQYNRTPNFIFLLPETFDRMDPVVADKLKEYVEAYDDNTDLQDELLKRLKAAEADRNFIGKTMYQFRIKQLSDTKDQAEEKAKKATDLVKKRTTDLDVRSKLPESFRARVDANPGVDPFNFENFTGHGSFTHFLKDRDIINWSIVQSEPDFTRVDIFGKPDLIDESQWPGGAMSFWAGAVDYDLWRMYGYKPQSYTKPFFNRFDSVVMQCAPYARTLMARQFHKVLKGSVTTAPYEGYRLGDVAFIEPLNMLYYIESITQNFVWGSQWTSTLGISYGRYPGQFIPHPFELVGSRIPTQKALIKSAGTVIGNTTGSPLENSAYVITFMRHEGKRPKRFLDRDANGERVFSFVKDFILDLANNDSVKKAAIKVIPVVDSNAAIDDKGTAPRAVSRVAEIVRLLGEHILTNKASKKIEVSPGNLANAEKGEFFVNPEAVVIKTDIVKAK